MTLKETMIRKLVEMGMFENQAIQVLELCKDRKEMESMVGRWNDSPDDYPLTFVGVLFISVAGVAYAWIEKNRPMAWYKSLFEQYATKI